MEMLYSALSNMAAIRLPLQVTSFLSAYLYYLFLYFKIFKSTRLFLGVDLIYFAWHAF